MAETILTRELRLRQAQLLLGANVPQPVPDEVKWGYTGVPNPVLPTNAANIVTSLVNEVASTNEIRPFLEGDSVAVESTLRNDQETGAITINEVGVLSGGTLIGYAIFREVYLEPADEYTFVFNLLGGGDDA